MKLPKRSDFATGPEFLVALDRWNDASEWAYHYLHGMVDATPPFPERPSWLDGKSGIVKWVEINTVSGLIEIALRNLSSSILHGGYRVKEVAHGNQDGPDGLPKWACYALCETKV